MKILIAAISALVTAGSAFAIDQGTAPPCNDRRWDAVGAIVQIPPGTPDPCAYYHNGSCVLIGPNTVLTASHTVEGATPTSPLRIIGPGDPVVHRVRFRRGTNGGENNTFTGHAPTDCTGDWQEFDVWKYEFLSPHASAPDGSTYTISRDLAILHLKTPVDGSGNYLPVPMITPLKVASYRTLYSLGSSIAPGNVSIAGWGRVGPCFDQGVWQLRTAFLGRLYDPITEEADFRTPSQLHGYGRIAWPSVNSQFEFITLYGGSCSDEKSPWRSTAVGSDYVSSLNMGPVADWNTMPSGNFHDSGGPIMVEIPVPGGGGELRVVGVITHRDAGVRIDNWNLWRWNHRLESDITELVPDHSTTGVAPCPADFNRDGVVDGNDMYSSTGYWTAYTGGKCIADMNGNSVVNIDDLLIFLNLTCP